ncbi:MAG: hypothetical protein ACRENO_00280 [Thermodesulfobacteriota bacterium]
MPKKNSKKVKDLVEMLRDPESSGYIGSDLDELDLYEQELVEFDEEDDDELEPDYEDESEYE